MDLTQLKETVSLTLVSERFGLSIHKSNGRQPCPFCNSSTAFQVTRNQHYNCFRCNKRGDIFNLLIDSEKATSFKEAVKLVSGLVGNTTHKAYEAQVTVSHSVWSAFTYGAYCYPEVIEAFKTKRGYKQEVELGYYPTAEEAPNFLEQFSKVPKDKLQERGLLNLSGRIIFPIHNASGQVMHFTGRAVDPTIEPRWLHSKGEPKINDYVFGLDRVYKDKTKDYAILTEGITDCLSLLQINEPALGCFGVNLPLVQHAWALKHLTHLVAFLDRDKYPLGSDKSGEYKSWSGMVPSLINLTVELKIPIWCCMVPDWSGVKDLNDFLIELEYNQLEFKRYLANNAITLHDFAFSMYADKPKQHELLWRLYKAVPDTEAINKLQRKVESKYSNWTDYLMEVLV